MNYIVCNECRFFHDPGVFRGTCSVCKYLFPSYVQENKPDMFSPVDQDAEVRYFNEIMSVKEKQK